MKLLAQVPNDTVSIVTTNTNYSTIVGLSPSRYVTTAINLLLGAAGVASFLFLLWGGIQWITAGGDKDAIEKARKKIVNALIGLAIVFSSYAILFVIRVLFNVNLIQFDLNALGSAGSAGGPSPSSIIGSPSAVTGNLLCGGCGGTRCGISGFVYRGTGVSAWECNASQGWVQQPDSTPVTSTSCGDCP